MRRIGLFGALTALALWAGCKTDCKDAYTHVVELTDADTNLSAPAKYRVLKAMRGEANQAAGVAQCQALALTPELLDCVADAEDLAGFAGCYGEKGPANANAAPAAAPAPGAAPTPPPPAAAPGAPPSAPPAAASPAIAGAWNGCENMFGWCPKKT